MNPIRGNSGVVKEPIKLTAQFMMCGSDKKEIRAGDMTAERRCVMDQNDVQPKSSTAGANLWPSRKNDTSLTINGRSHPDFDHKLYLQSLSYDEFIDDVRSRV